MENLKDEKLFPISINPHLCVRCERCMYSCHPKAIYFVNSMRYVDYDKCRGCLKCVDVCEHGAIEVISLEEGKIQGFYIDAENCTVCKKCLNDEFCPEDLFELLEDENGNHRIEFRNEYRSRCNKSLKCFKNCPNNAIIPIIK